MFTSAPGARLAFLPALLLALLLPVLPGRAQPAAAGEPAAESQPANEKLRSLRGELAAFLAKDPGSAAESRQLAARLGHAEFAAGHEPAAAERAGLLAEIAGMRARLAAAAPGRVAAETAPGLGAATAILSGRVQAAAGGAGIPQASLSLLDSGGYYAGSAWSDISGLYLFAGLPPGTYRLEVRAYDPPFGAQAWDGVACPYGLCPLESATPIVLEPGENFTADFRLEALAEIHGTVRASESGQPLPNFQVQLYHGPGFSGISAFTDAAGNYRLAGIERGTYYVAVTDSPDRPGMLYGGQVCQLPPYDFQLGCDRAGAERLSLERGQVRAGIDFSVARGANIRGRVRDAATGLPVAGSTLYLQDLDSGYRAVASTGAGSDYVFSGLKSGRWQLIAETSGYMVQTFRLRDCLAAGHCAAGFDPVATVQGELAEGIDFALARPGTATGQVVDQVSRQPLVGAYVSAYSPDGYPLGAATTDTAGFFSLPYLPATEVVFRAEALGYVPEYYENVDLRAGIGAAKRVTIRSSEVTSGIEISPSPLGGITGRAVDAASGEPITSCLVTAHLLDAPPLLADWNSGCQADGSFELAHLWPGSYRLWITPQDGHAPYLFGVGSCNLGESYPREPLCDLGGPTVPVSSGALTAIGELRLEAAAGIFGNVSLQGLQLPAAGPHPQVELFDAAGRRIAGRELYNPNQSYGFTDLAPGTYYVVLDGIGAFGSQAWNGVACSRWFCDPRRGQPLALSAGDSRGGIDFVATPLPPYAGCTESATALCLQGGRFKVETTWHDFLGQSGPGQAVRVTDETAYFWFFDPGNVELMVKALNACTSELGLKFWIFAAGLTNVEVELKVTDTLTGEVRTYGNPRGQVIAPILDIGAFASCAVPEPTAAAAAPSLPAAGPPAPLEEVAPRTGGDVTCVDTPNQICLAGGRFQVGATFRVSPQDASFLAPAQRLTGDTATFNFFSENNVELIVKVLDACDQALPGYWVFAAGLTDLEVEIAVQDSVTGRIHYYRNDFGPFQTQLDLTSFAASCN